MARIIRRYRNVIAEAYGKYTPLEQKVTGSYESVFGLPCDVYFPVHNPQKGRTYQQINVFEGHELPYYEVSPSLQDVHFIIPGLMRKESMNSVADQFDNFVLKSDMGEARPFIETSPDRELPMYSKIVVKIKASNKSYFVDQKTVVNGASGHMLMRMYLSPLTEDKTGAQ